MATPEWKETWRPASFRGVQFHVDVGNHVGGRRGMDFEFPKQDEPYFEDLGRRGAKRAVTGYVLGSDYVRRAQELQDAPERRRGGHADSSDYATAARRLHHFHALGKAP
jgi:prophage DNA circulation protein